MLRFTQRKRLFDYGTVIEREMEANHEIIGRILAEFKTMASRYSRFPTVRNV